MPTSSIEALFTVLGTIAAAVIGGIATVRAASVGKQPEIRTQPAWRKIAPRLRKLLFHPAAIATAVSRFGAIVRHPVMKRLKYTAEQVKIMMLV